MRAEQRANQAAVAKDQEARTAHLKQFIARFGHGNKKMAKQAQSRMKMLKRMADEAVEVARARRACSPPQQRDTRAGALRASLEGGALRAAPHTSPRATASFACDTRAEARVVATCP